MATRELSEVSVPRVTIAASAPTATRERASTGAMSSDWDRYVQAVREHWVLVLSITLIGTLLGVAAAGRVEPQYAARSVIWIENSEADAVGRAGSGRLLDATSWMELLTAGAVLDSVVRPLRLYLTPASPADAARLADFHVGTQVAAGTYEFVVDRDGAHYTLHRGDVVVERGVVGDSVGRPLGFAWVPSRGAVTGDSRTKFTVEAPVDAVARLARGLRGSVDAGASFLRLELRGSDAKRTTATLNAVAERGVAVAATLKRQRLQELDRILGGQYRHAEQELRAAERALAAFRVQGVQRLERAQVGGVATSDDELTAVAALGATRDQLRRDRIRIEALLQQPGEDGVSLEALGAVPAVSEAPQLRSAIDEATRRQAEMRVLRYRYSDESAPVSEARAALAALRKDGIPTLARALATDLKSREQAFAPRVDSAFGRLRAAPSLAIEEARLARRLESAEVIFDNVGERLEANRLALLSSLPDLHVLDPAVEPHTPASDLAPLLIVLSFVTSFGISVLGVRMRDQMDSRIRHPNQVTGLLQLSILACLPRVGWSRLARGASAGEEVIESLRALRVRLLQARGRGALAVTVSSPSCGDGKSFVSVNLAISFAQAGYRTLLVDGDARRGVQHRVLGVSPRPGLVDVLAEDHAVSDVVQATSHAGLDVLSAGSRSQRAPELIMSARLSAAMASLRDAYDVIIVDSPPLAAGVDALVLAALTENLLLVLRSGTTDLPLALAKLELADAHPVRLVGAVLNDVRGQGAFRNYAYDLRGYRLGEEVLANDVEPQRVLGGRP